LDGGSGNDQLAAGEDFGRFTGGPGRDRMVGGQASDVFREGRSSSGADTMIGQGGRDVVSYSGRRRGIRADLSGDRDDGQRGERDRIGRDVEDLVGGPGRDRLRGNGRLNILQGLGGSDRLTGGDGGDRVLGGRGNDRIAVRDRATDYVDCGRGSDRAALDGLDVLPGGAGCNRLARRGGVRALLDLIGPGTPDEELGGRRYFVGGNQTVIDPVCPADARSRCNGHLRVLDGGREMGAANYSVRRGAEQGVDVFFSAADAARIRTRRELPVTVELTTSARGADRRASFGIVLVASP
ncbi:MAG: hypothetical protein M3375_07990, partial [Actinomycetota bacterium]|nr:hypothetical protein [Actinomycetota bacterium]